MDFELQPPSVRYHQSWLTSWAEWGRGVHQDGASLGRAERAGLDLTRVEQFAEWVELLLIDADTTLERPADMVPSSTAWVIEGDEYIGSVQLRYSLTDALLDRGGHIGYGIRPAARRRGAAGFALAGIVQRARRLGLPRVLITCDDDNAGSARVIERCGGVLEDTRTAAGLPPWRRYWITTTG